MRFAVSIVGRSPHAEGAMLHHSLSILEAPDADVAKGAAEVVFRGKPGREQAKLLTVLAEPIPDLEW